MKLQVILKTLLELEGHYHTQSLAYGATLAIHMEPLLDGCSESLLSYLLYYSPPQIFFIPCICSILVRQTLVCSFYVLMGKTLDPTMSSVKHQQERIFLIYVNTILIYMHIYSLSIFIFYSYIYIYISFFMSHNCLLPRQDLWRHGDY